MGALMEREPVPFAKVEQIAAQVNELHVLQAKQQALQAEMIRACLAEIRSDPRNHRMRGHENATERARIIKENINNQARALLYLEQLATMLENESCRVTRQDQPKDTESCTPE